MSCDTFAGTVAGLGGWRRRRLRRIGWRRWQWWSSRKKLPDDVWSFLATEGARAALAFVAKPLVVAMGVAKPRCTRYFLLRNLLCFDVVTRVQYVQRQAAASTTTDVSAPITGGVMRHVQKHHAKNGAHMCAHRARFASVRRLLLRQHKIWTARRRRTKLSFLSLVRPAGTRSGGTSLHSL